jgi:hypothetical protein
LDVNSSPMKYSQNTASLTSTALAWNIVEILQTLR